MFYALKSVFKTMKLCETFIGLNKEWILWINMKKHNIIFEKTTVDSLHGDRLAGEETTSK